MPTLVAAPWGSHLAGTESYMDPKADTIGSEFITLTQMRTQT